LEEARMKEEFKVLKSSEVRIQGLHGDEQKKCAAIAQQLADISAQLTSWEEALKEVQNELQFSDFILSEKSPRWRYPIGSCELPCCNEYAVVQTNRKNPPGRQGGLAKVLSNKFELIDRIGRQDELPRTNVSPTLDAIDSPSIAHMPPSPSLPSAPSLPCTPSPDLFPQASSPP
jgi:hypothetical protein